MPVTFKGRQFQTNIDGVLAFYVDDRKDRVAKYLRGMHEAARKKNKAANEIDFEITVKRYFARRSLKANALYAILVDKLAEEKGTHPDLVREGMKTIYGPEHIEGGLLLRLPSHLCSTIQMAHYIDGAFLECSQEGIDAYDEYVRYKMSAERQAIDENELYPTKKKYREMHPFCEASGKHLWGVNIDGADTYLGHIHHIIPVGRGGEDKAYNWAALYGPAHRLRHDNPEAFLKEYPHLKYKFAKAEKIHEKGLQD